MLPIKGFQKTCLVDYPPYTASTVFLGGCNFKCGFCHNPDLVIDFSFLDDIPQHEIIEYLDSKKQWIDGVCITGGEPLLYPSIVDFIVKLKNQGLLVKIDTNGTNPALLKELLSKNLIDRVAMDIKGPLEKYSAVTCVSVDKENIKQSVELLQSSDIEYEFRTTVIPGLIGKDEILSIGEWLKGSKKFAIQNFRYNKPMIDESFSKIRNYTQEELESLKLVALPYFDSVEIRN